MAHIREEMRAGPMENIIDLFCGGQFNNRRKIKSRYIQEEKIMGFKYGKRRIKQFADSPARCQREVRKLRKIKGFEKVTRIWDV